jgi:predicted RNase H-like HicB family nuclease
METDEITNMNDNYTAIIKQSGQRWIGWIEEVSGVNCQETTKEELLESLRETLREALDATGDNFEETSITI